MATSKSPSFTDDLARCATSAAAYTDDTGLPPSHSTVSMSCTSRSRKIPPLGGQELGCGRAVVERRRPDDDEVADRAVVHARLDGGVALVEASLEADVERGPGAAGGLHEGGGVVRPLPEGLVAQHRAPEGEDRPQVREVVGGAARDDRADDVLASQVAHVHGRGADVRRQRGHPAGVTTRDLHGEVRRGQPGGPRADPRHPAGADDHERRCHGCSPCCRWASSSGPASCAYASGAAAR